MDIKYNILTDQQIEKYLSTQFNILNSEMKNIFINSTSLYSHTWDIIINNILRQNKPITIDKILHISKTQLKNIKLFSRQLLCPTEPKYDTYYNIISLSDFKKYCNYLENSAIKIAQDIILSSFIYKNPNNNVINCFRGIISKNDLSNEQLSSFSGITSMSYSFNKAFEFLIDDWDTNDIHYLYDIYIPSNTHISTTDFCGQGENEIMLTYNGTISNFSKKYIKYDDIISYYKISGIFIENKEIPDLTNKTLLIYPKIDTLDEKVFSTFKYSKKNNRKSIKKKNIKKSSIKKKNIKKSSIKKKNIKKSSIKKSSIKKNIKKTSKKITKKSENQTFNF